MSLQIPITQKELRSIRRVLRTQEQVVCLDNAAYVKTTLIAMDMLQRGKDFKAKIVDGYSAKRKTDSVPATSGIGTSLE